MSIFSTSGEGEHVPTGSHERYERLCAFAPTGELTPKEQEELEAHLRTCVACRQRVEQFEQVMDTVFSVSAIDNFDEEVEDSEMNWSPELAEAALFSRLHREERVGEHNVVNENFSLPSKYPVSKGWQDVWVLSSAGLVLFFGLAFFAYRLGIARGSHRAATTPPGTPQVSTAIGRSLEEQLAEATYASKKASEESSQGKQLIAELQDRLRRKATEIADIKATADRLRDSVQSDTASIRDLSTERADLADKLEKAETASTTLEEKLAVLTEQSARDAEIARAAEAEVSELTRRLADREKKVEERDVLLAHDRDIRELMGARDLYIAEVHDVARDGQTQKTYGRVFYTKGKSLIFYAFDLGEGSDLKQANAFQAWGRRGSDREQAVNLGVFYEDSASKNRWVLKCDDPKTLAQIDAVFVTMEPHGGSHKPSGKSLLFAYLKLEPNHP